MISLVTNIDSLIAQQNLSVNSQFQSKTIQQLTSGYRINSSADDAAGLSVANGYRNQIASLNQGVLNANQGVSQLQIIDGGLSNISQILDRMTTLATESASQTFTGSRTTLNNEYTNLSSEITRQAENIGLNAGGINNTTLGVYIGGGNISNVSGTNVVQVNLTGLANAVDAVSLGLSTTNVNGGASGGVGFNSDTTRLDDPTQVFLSQGTTQTFTFNYTEAGGYTQTRNVTVTGTTDGLTGQQVIDQLNQGLSGTGINAFISANTTDGTLGTLQFSADTGFMASVAASSGSGAAVETSAAILNNGSTGYGNYAGQYNASAAFTAFSGTTALETFTVNDGTNNISISLTAGNAGSLSQALTTINTALQGAGITDVSALGATSGGSSEISFQGSSNFSIVETNRVAGTGSLFGSLGNVSVAAPTSGSSAGNSAQDALTALTKAVAQLGLVQGVVGAGENTLNYAINLAQSQITSYSSAESQIRDANVAQEAAHLTQSQVMQQASIAAMAQANQEPQAILSLLKG